MYELSVSRFIDAPPERVWDVMANRLPEWFCPAPWRAEIDAQDRRAGGRCDMTFHGPDGETMPQRGIFLAWEEGRRWVSTDAAVIGADGDFEPAEAGMIGYWEIAPEGSGTRYTARARHWSEDGRKAHEEMGFEEGWGAVADGLKALCEAG